MVGIYKITNTLNNKVYIGQSKDIENRWKYHIYQASRSKKHNILLYKALNKYGYTAFKFDVLEECEVDELDDKEIYYIKLYDSYNSGYNMTNGGDKGPTLSLDKNPNSILTLDEVKKIRELYTTPISRHDAYVWFCENVKRINKHTFNSIWGGHSYKGYMMHVFNEKNKYIHKHQQGRNHISVVKHEDVMNIRLDKKTGLRYKDATVKYKHININTFNDIWRGKTFKKIQP